MLSTKFLYITYNPMGTSHPIPDIEEADLEEMLQNIENSTNPSKFAILPRKYELTTGETIYVHGSSTPTLRKIFDEKNIEETPIENEELPIIHERDTAFIGPLLFISKEFIVNNWGSILTIVHILHTYAKDEGADTASVGVKYESPDGELLNLNYEGDPDNLPEIIDSIRTDYEDYEELEDYDENLETSDGTDE